MRHRVRKIRLGRKPHMARMLLRNLLTSALLYEEVRTTKSRAQAVRPMIDRVITIAKKDPQVVAIRRIGALVTDKNACRKALEVYAKRYADRNSGFTRMRPAGMRGGDGALLVDVSFVEGKDVPEKSPETQTSAAKTVKKSASKKSAKES